MAMAGPRRIVAVGWRGLVVVSDDRGSSWRQAQVGVSVDLTSVCFTNPQHGWAAGADGVLLESMDGGLSWQKRFDGHLAARGMVEKYQALAAARPGDKAAGDALVESQAYVKEGPGRPILDVAFEDERTGYAVGAYGIAFRTTDGGKHWEPILDLLANPNGYHLYAIGMHRGGLFVVGELGTLLLLDRAQDRFVKVPVPYEGTFFTIVSGPQALVVAGLRGNALVSTDGGTTWQKADFAEGLPGSFSSGTVLGDGTLVLATQSGQLFKSTEGGRRFRQLNVKAPMLYSALVDVGGGGLLTAGSRGLRVENLG
jgi:photosystem II stability/assembly factor-like uncharacterized protein